MIISADVLKHENISKIDSRHSMQPSLKTEEMLNRSAFVQ